MLWTYPLVTDLSGQIPGDGPGDNLQFLWNFWWMRMALAGGLDVYYTSFMFAPVGSPLTLHTLTALPAFVAATVLAKLPVVAAMNVMILASLFLNGFCAYLLAWRVTGDRGAAMIGGLTFGGSSYLAGHLLGHFNLTSAWTVPLFAMAALEAVKGRKAWAVVAGLVLAATAYTDYYYLIFEGALGAVIVATAMGDWSVTFQGRGSTARTRMTRTVGGARRTRRARHRHYPDYRWRGLRSPGPERFRSAASSIRCRSSGCSPRCGYGSGSGRESRWRARITARRCCPSF